MPSPTTIADAVVAALEADRADMHTWQPGKVLSYDPDTQTCSVQPLLRRVLFDAAGNKSYETLPALSQVPVANLRTSRFVLHVPLEEGDYVQLLFSEASLAEYRATGELSDPGDTRRHSCGYPVAYPAFFPDSQPLTPTDPHADTMIIGEDGTQRQIRITDTHVDLGARPTPPTGPSLEALARGPALDTLLTALSTWAAAVSTAVGDPTLATATTAFAAAVTTAQGALQTSIVRGL